MPVLGRLYAAMESRNMSFSKSDIKANREYFERHLQAMKYKLDVIKRLKGEYQGDEFLLLDVRTRAGYAKGHIPGALCAPESELEQLMPQLPREKELAVYCWSDT